MALCGRVIAGWLRGVWKRYAGISGGRGMSASARAGEVTEYPGPNGSGKSTTMKMIAELIECRSGRSCLKASQILIASLLILPAMVVVVVGARGERCRGDAV